MADPARSAIARAYRDHHGRVLASLIRVVGDFQLAEDALGDAFATAVERWAEEGVPRNPGAWLTTVARNRATDRLRRARTVRHHAEALARLEELARENIMPVDDMHLPDDRLRLIFTCCHPALSQPARVALTLRTLGGLSTAEIARAFLVPEPTMAQRLVRAKRKIRGAGIPYEIPDPKHLAQRLDGVLQVIYLVFNEGYAASFGDHLLRADLCEEAIRLAEVLRSLLPGEPEVAGLVALMQFHHGRRHARVDAAGDLVVLEEQDRNLWDRELIARGREALDRALTQRRPGPYQIQAAIASLHAHAPTAADTDWVQIAKLYGVLLQMSPSAVVELNHAVAVAMAHGIDRGLELLEAVEQDQALAGYHLLPAARADLLRRSGQSAAAAKAYQEALALVQNDRERRYLERRLAEVGARVN